jgi:hypothetical protein
MHNGLLFVIKKDEIMPFEAKWMDLEIIIWSEISQAQKSQTLHVFTHMWTLGLK